MLLTYKHFVGDTKGWVEVKKSELARLGLLDSISSASYEKDNYIYLDEDIDFSFFLLSIGNKIELIEISVNDDYFYNYKKYRGDN